VSDRVHGVSPIDAELRLHHVKQGSGPRTVVLIHGFPETWWEWREVMPRLANAGWRVVAVDYRGAGNSTKPAGGYDKRTMAADIRSLLREHLNIHDPVAVVGHDIGAMVAYAYAAHFRDDTSHLSLLDSVLPGTQGFERMRSVPRVWHFSFHAVRDLPEILVQGREREYLRFMIEQRICDPGAFTAEVIETYVQAYQAPGAMRAAFELYRAFERDAADVRSNLHEHGKLRLPVQCLTGAAGPLDKVMGAQIEEVATRVAHMSIPDTSHWLIEERPEQVAAALLRFLESA
jgi:pimeloyl-ACP methyl ester carboxylesterase